MSTVLFAKIEACAQLAEGKTPQLVASDFKKKVKKVTKLTESGFIECGVCMLIHSMLSEGCAVGEVLRAMDKKLGRG